jgi:hypothetical protein
VAAYLLEALPAMTNTKEQKNASTVPDTGPARAARIDILREGGRPLIRVTVPAGTRLEDTFRLRDKIAEISRNLTGCSACNSGVPLFFREAELVEHVVRVDLDTMTEIKTP